MCYPSVSVARSRKWAPELTAPLHRKGGQVDAPYVGGRCLFKDSPGGVAAPAHVRTSDTEERPDTAGKGRFEFALIVNLRTHTPGFAVGQLGSFCQCILATSYSRSNRRAVARGYVEDTSMVSKESTESVGPRGWASAGEATREGNKLLTSRRFSIFCGLQSSRGAAQGYRRRAFGQALSSKFARVGEFGAFGV